MRFVTAWLALLFFAASAPAREKILLTNGWAIQSSAKIQAGGQTVSVADFAAGDWYPATVPSTVVGTLVDDKVFPDPFFGTNLRTLPGMDYPIGYIFNTRPMSNSSPYITSWWYRKVFSVPGNPGGQIWLNFDGINCRANLWLNGKRFAGTNEVIGAYRTYRFNVTGLIAPNGDNALAVEIFAPTPRDLAINWVDWNPTPPDKNMGLWRDVYLTMTGPVALHDPQVITKVAQPALDTARLEVSTEVENAGAEPANAIVDGTVGKIHFQKSVALQPHESKRVHFTPEEFPALVISHPDLWWPLHMGPQNLQRATLRVSVDGKASDEQEIRFGIREVTSELTGEGFRLFKINGKPVLVRGGGWAPDIFLRPNAEREKQEIRYVRDMNLNAIRFEGKTESDRFLDLCDENGILVIAGWCCCDYWEQTPKWKDIDYQASGASLSNQLCRIRNHPSILTFWYGSDTPPNNRAETNYLAIFKQVNWPYPKQSSASGKKTKAGEPTGMRMTGPYNYVPPMYWYTDTEAGAAHSFNTETSCGPAIPPIESLRKMLPENHLWPIDSVWSYHAGGGPFKSLAIYNDALARRYGPPTGLEDYAMKSQVMAYDGVRAMFEAYGCNKYHSTGVIQWMMNNAWPSVIWHLYDYYLRPGGGYYGAKTACQPLHIQYSFADRSIVVVNSYQHDFTGLTAEARIFNLDMVEKFSQQAPVKVGADGVVRIFQLPEPMGLSGTYFIKLTLKDSHGELVSRNFYWLSTKPETLDKPQEGSDWYYTPTKDYADLTALTNLPQVNLKLSAASSRHGSEEVTKVTVRNPSRTIAFFVHLKVMCDDEEILPVLWEDNYFELMPGEKREITASYAAAQLGGKTPVAEVNGWNVVPATIAAH